MTEASDFVAWLRTKRQASPLTCQTYQRLCEAWTDFLPTPLPERTPEDVEAFCGRPRRGNTGAAPATVAHEVSILSSFYRWGMARHTWPSNPALLAAKPKVRNKNPRPVHDDVWMALWGNPRLTDEARVALGLGYFAGLRRAEVSALTGSQIWGRMLVNFTRKGGGEDRMDLGDLLDHWSVHRPDLLVDAELVEGPLRRVSQRRGSRRLMSWPSPSPKALNHQFDRWLAWAGMAPGTVTPHMLRHSFATNLVRTNVPLPLVKELCNHSSIDTTMRYVKISGGTLATLRPTQQASTLVTG